MRILIFLTLTLFLFTACTLSDDLNEVAADLERGKTFYEQGEYQKALLQFKRMENLFPKNHFFPILSGQSYRMLGEKDLAQTFFSKSLRLKPFYHLALIELALIEEENHKHFQAIDKMKSGYKRFKKSLEETSAYSGEELWVLAQILSAEKIHLQVIEFYLTDHLATLYRQISDFKNAELWLERADNSTFNDSSRAAVLREKGIISLLNDKPSDALEYFSRACPQETCQETQTEFKKITAGFIVKEIDSGGFELYLKGAEYAASDAVAALGYFKRACEQSINFPSACLKTVDGLFKLKEPQLAEPHLKKMLTQNYSDLSIRRKYIQFLSDQQRFSEASDIIENTRKAVVLTTAETAEINSLWTQIKEKGAIKKLLENYFSWHRKQSWKEIYAAQSDFLKQRVSLRMFEENCNRKFSAGQFDNCRLTSIEVDAKRAQAVVAFDCPKSESQTLRMIQKNNTWKLVASENQDVFDDFLQHQKELAQ